VSVVVKTVTSILVAPLAIAMLIAAAGLLIGNRPRGRRWLLISAALLAYCGSTSIVGDALLGPLEHQYAPLRFDHPVSQTILVLGSGYQPHDAVPITAALDKDGLVRLVEGVRLAHRDPSIRLIVSGGAAPGDFVPALGYAELARDLGVESSRLVIVSSPQNTAEEARAIVKLLGHTPFVLVTSAYHMPRAIRQMMKAGASPIPAPTGQLTGGAKAYGWRSWMPTSDGLGKCERALHEYLGLAALAVGLG
jgi:uncharacterized SAM-binding protein YcdF (DUF218 family)